MMLRANQLDRDRACVLVIDLQEKILPLVRDPERVILATRKLLDGARVFELPVLATEQYTKGLGPTDPAVVRCLEAASASRAEKPTFSAWAEPGAREAMLTIDRPQVIVAGIETHICVQQTVLDLVSRDYDVFVCADATDSRGRLDYKVALSRLRQEGAWVTTVEAVLFELCGRADTARFKALLQVIKEYPPAS